MKAYKDLIKTPEYWMEEIQNEIFRQVYNYKENENINQTELADRLNVSKGYISQILNGNFNFSLKKLIELSLQLEVVPNLLFEPIQQYIKRKENENVVSLHDTISLSFSDRDSDTTEITNASVDSETHVMDYKRGAYLSEESA